MGCGTYTTRDAPDLYTVVHEGSQPSCCGLICYQCRRRFVRRLGLDLQPDDDIRRWVNQSQLPHLTRAVTWLDGGYAADRWRAVLP